MSNLISIERVDKLLRGRAKGTFLNPGDFHDVEEGIAKVNIGYYLQQNCYPEAAFVALQIGSEEEKRNETYRIFRREATHYEELRYNTKNVFLKGLYLVRTLAERRLVRNVCQIS